MRHFLLFSFLFLLLTLASCSEGKDNSSAAAPRYAQSARSVQNAQYARDANAREESLVDLAEKERAGGFVQGLGLAESAMREQDGDYAGAALAAYKELAWAYGYGAVSKEAIEHGLNSVKELFQIRQYDEGVNKEEIIESVNSAVNGILAFINGDWVTAEHLIARTSADDYETDSFAQWMLMVCRLETGNGGKAMQSAYSGIRSRYVNFPEYWYRGALSAAPSFGAVAADFAERCINLAPDGPYASECRKIIAGVLGLPMEEAPSIKTMAEIERAVAQAAHESKPEALSILFPLISLPDNTYTLYAAGAMRTLAKTEAFASYFLEQQERSSGRLAERLAYIARGNAL
ncbi:MAG: hypothetical protein LBG43_08460 [Treponema sp.]|jgi:hypothetical protein|nr:hypothetical protein [Treponema sp.]